MIVAALILDMAAVAIMEYERTVSATVYKESLTMAWILTLQSHGAFVNVRY